MKLAPGSAAMTLVLALLTAVGPLSTDMYLPSLPAISSALGATAPAVQLTLSAFLAGFAAGQLVHGPLSDHFGRRPVLLTGLAIFVLGSAACAYARDIEILIVSRFFQAIGASAATVLARAIVRDLHGGKDAARLLSFMGALMGIVPLAVPVFGGYLQTAFGWRASFFTTALLALALMLVSITFLPETLDRTSRGKWQARAMIEDFTGLLASPVFIRYLISICLGFAGLFTFISGSSFVLQNYYGLGEVAFGLAFSFCVAGYISGTLAGA
ncbi:MAG TPA: Bcr/CflA family efflux MFS transporter, partial [Rhizobiales bacterium]|nr:Bcr/CflA family efflux MFS transporter [Hyphomicrobiales bacterium]